MDQNKADKLKEIGYEIKPSCGTCKHFKQYVDPEFGDCGVHKYVHLKHTGGQKRLSVVVYGYCTSYEPSDLDFLHGFKEYLTPAKK